MRLDVVGETVDVLVDRRCDALAGRRAKTGAQPVRIGAAQRRMVEDAAWSPSCGARCVLPRM